MKLVGVAVILFASLALASTQTFTTLYNFPGGTNGANPAAGLLLSGGTLYGTTCNGGSGGSGTVFKVNTDGSGFTVLKNFSPFLNSMVASNSDGGYPEAVMVLSGSTLYGTTFFGGSWAAGVVFKVNTNGLGFAVVTNFVGLESWNPSAGLVLSGGTLYGTSDGGGSSANGTVFKVNTDGSGYTILYSFSAPATYLTNSDGGAPWGGLILFGNTLYGTAAWGGSSGNGTVFKVNTDGSGFTVLKTFAGGSDGANPAAGLLLSDGTLYGTTSACNSGSSYGTVFKVNTDGSGFTVLKDFSPLVNYTNSDGAYPYAGLVLSGNTLYGTTEDGGSSGNGTVFQINTNGSGFTVLKNFSPLVNNTNSDGAHPEADLVLSGVTLYGTTSDGGSSGKGTVFSLVLHGPPLTLIRSGANAIFTWPTNPSGLTLQCATNLVTSVVWKTNLPAPVVVNGRNTVTNPITGKQQFFRLISN